MPEARKHVGHEPTYISFGGGLNENDDFSISLDECVAGENFKLSPRSKTWRPRDPQDLLGTAPNAGAVKSIMQLIKRDNTETTLVMAGNIVYDWDGSSTFTPVKTLTASKLRDTYWSLDDVIVVTDLGHQNVLWRWNGSTFTRHKTNLGVGNAQALTSLTGSGTTATAVFTSHGLATDDLVLVTSADATEYNGEFQVTVPDANTFTYTTTSVSTDTATGASFDKGLEVYAKYAAVFNNRLWLFNIKAGSTTTAHMVLASAFEDANDLDTATRSESGGIAANDAFYILSPDLKPINGVAVFYDQLIISTVDGKLFKLTGSDATDYKFSEYYQGSAATGTETIQNIGNDVIYMKEGGNIDLVSSTDRYGDISADDVSRWIPDTIAGITDAITVYDQTRQLVFFFVSNKVLVLNKESLTLSELSPWSVYTTQLDSAFNTDAAKYVTLPGGSTKTVIWGDDSGNVYDMNGTGTGDNGTNIFVRRKTRNIFEVDSINHIIHGRVQYRRKGTLTLDMTFNWAEEYKEYTCSIPLKGPITGGSPAFFGGDYYFAGDVHFNSGIVESDRVSTVGYDPAGKGPSFFIDMRISSTVNFLINRIQI